MYSGLKTTLLFLVTSSFLLLSACKSDFSVEKNYGYLFSAEDCQSITIKNDKREVLQNTKPMISQWFAVNHSDELLYSMAITVNELTDNHTEPVHINTNKLKLQKAAQTVLNQAAEPDRTFDKYPCTFQIRVESEKNTDETIYSEVIDPNEKTEYKKWQDQTISLAAWAGQRIRIHFNTQHHDQSANQPFFTNPLLKRKSTVTPEPGIILVSLDTLRSDHVGCYGYPRHVSPNIDWFSKHAYQYCQTITPTPWTLPTHVSLFTGIEPPKHGVENRNDSALSTDVPTITQLFRKAGYLTFGFTEGGYLGPGWGLSRGFHRYHYSGMIDTHISLCLEWLDRVIGNVPFFCFLHTYEIHTPYNSRHPRFLYAKKTSKEVTYSKATVPKDPTPEELRNIIDNYDEGIRFADEVLGHFILELMSRNLFAHSQMIIFSDHGEEFYEHGVFEHGTQLFSETLMVPLLWYKPDAVGQTMIDTPVSLVSLVPSLLHSAAIPIGSSFNYPVLPHSTHSNSSDAFITSSTKIDQTLLRLCNGRTAILHIQHSNMDTTDLYKYDLNNDPQEIKPESYFNQNPQLISYMSELNQQMQVWITSYDTVSLVGSIEWTGFEPVVINNPHHFPFIRKEKQISFNISEFTGQFALSFFNESGTIKVNLRMNDVIPLCQFIYRQSGSMVIESTSELLLPCPTLYSKKHESLHPPSLPDKSIIMFAYPDRMNQNEQGLEKPSESTLEQIKALGYIE